MATRVIPARKVVSGSVDIAEPFNQLFTTVFSSDIEESRSQLAPIGGPVREEISLSRAKSLSNLVFLTLTNHLDLMGSSQRLLKETAEQIAPSLTLLYNKSLETGVFPDAWKLRQISYQYIRKKKEHGEIAQYPS